MTQSRMELVAHPEVASEQQYLDYAHACLARMHDHLVYLFSLGYPGEARSWADVKQWEIDTQRRIASMEETSAALCFGRVDETDGDRWYIGRRHVEDGRGEPVVVDWRAPVATSFYRATVADPLGLRRRRRFLLADRELIDVLDEDLEHPGDKDAGAYVPDPLLAEITRARTGEMRDIVATIQAEQDVIIRAPLDCCIVTQGGPGTGKTAVGLHRAAFLLYEHRELLERQRLLIVGPNPLFLRYISQVLPSLGETASSQLTVEGLAGARYRLAEVDTPETARLKGDVRMAAVLSNAVFGRIEPPGEDLDVATRFGKVVLPATDMADLVADLRDRRSRANHSRNALRAQLIQLAWDQYATRATADASHRPMLEADVRAAPGFKAMLAKSWPATTAAALLRRLYANEAMLERASHGVLEPFERRLLLRRPAARASEQRWSRADLALLDEAEALTEGIPQSYGHIVVDEAQDLSAMELRMIARRSRQGSLTILGDLAQSTSPGAQTRWEEAVDYLGRPAGGRLRARPTQVRIEELTIGYRVPGPIMEFANRLLPDAAPGVRPARSVRPSGDPPRVLRVSSEVLETETAYVVAELAARLSSVAVVVPGVLRERVAEALSARGVDFLDGQDALALGDHVTLLPPSATKGLEFDAVVAVEPAQLADDSPAGGRLLYVVLTRAVQELVIVHAQPLPGPLAQAGRSTPPSARDAPNRARERSTAPSPTT